MIGVRIEMQFTPSRTAGAHVKVVVRSAFATEMFRSVEWTTPRGEDRELPAGVSWADPTLQLHITDPDRGSRQVLADLAPALGAALGRVRRELPQLPFGIRVTAQEGDLWLAIGVWDAAPEVDAAFAAAATHDWHDHGVFGWDASANSWMPI
jgi:hypothetical protein